MRALSLEYHDVVDGDDFDCSGFPGAGPASYKIRRDVFEQHLEAIARRIAQPPRLALNPPEDRTPHVFLTFDDGGRSAYTVIADALERRGWRGHFFVTAGQIGQPTFLAPPEIRELHNRGHVIGAHSYSHPARMGACGIDQLHDEWRRSVAILSDILGAAVVTGSVPGGFYTKRVAETAAISGLQVLFTSTPTMAPRQVGPCLVLGRYTLRQWSAPATAAALAGGAWAARAAQHAVYGGLTILRTITGDRYTQLRQSFWARRGA